MLSAQVHSNANIEALTNAVCLGVDEGQMLGVAQGKRLATVPPRGRFGGHDGATAKFFLSGTNENARCLTSKTAFETELWAAVAMESHAKGT